MNELITIKSTPALFTADFENAIKLLEEELKQYDVVVTADTIKGAKEFSTELNKTGQAIDQRRKDEVAAVSEPIHEFESKMKAMVGMCYDGRAKLLDQIKVFEDVTRTAIKEMLTELREELYQEMDVEPEFKTVSIDDLAIMSNQTSTGNLTAKAVKEVEARVEKRRDEQAVVNGRIEGLKIRCEEAGLTTPLEKVHIIGFLYEPEDVYQEKLSLLMKVERKRETAAQEANKPPTDIEKEAKKEFPKSPAPEGKKHFVVTAIFEVPAPSNTDKKRISDKFHAVMREAGITTLKKIEVE